MQDHRNASLRKWLVEEYFFGEQALGSPNVDGVILDDGWGATGPTEENGASVADMGLSAADVAHIATSWSISLNALNVEVEKRGKYVVPTYAGDSMSTRSHNHTQCAQRMRQLGCSPGSAATGPMVFTVRFTKAPI